MGMDLQSTFMELAGIDSPTYRRIDGFSICGLLLNGDALPGRRVFFGYEPKLGTAMRDEDWKMIVKLNKLELYDLSKDICEQAENCGRTPVRRSVSRSSRPPES